MLGAIFIGIGLGLSLSVAAGPVFMMIVDTSLEKGKMHATAFAAGVWTSDSLYALLTYLGVNWVTKIAYNPQYADKISFIGALILMIFGIGILMDNGSDGKKTKLRRKRDAFKLYAKGFLINTFNPFTVVFWLGISGGIVVHQFSSAVNAFLLYAGLLGTVILIDVLKIFLADKVSELLKTHVIARIRKVTGVALLLASFLLLYRTFF